MNFSMLDGRGFPIQNYQEFPLTTTSPLMTSLIMSRFLPISNVLTYVDVVVLYYDQFGNQGKVKGTVWAFRFLPPICLEPL